MIPINAIHKRRIVSQIEQNLTGLQRDMNSNARSHKAMAQARSPSIATLGAFISDCSAQYLTRLQWIIDLRNDPVRRQRLLDMLASVGWTEQEITDYVQGLRQAAVAYRDALKTTYAQMEAAADAMILAVDMPESLWPE